jgi:DNA-binding MarR family transcriptional regulator
MGTIKEQNHFDSLFRKPYRSYVEWLYERLAATDFPEIRMTHNAVFRLIERKGSRVTDLAEHASMTKQSMAYLVEDLVTSGYVMTMSDPTDGRAKLVVLTKKGSNLMTAARRLGHAYERHIATLLGTEKAYELRNLLETLNDALEHNPTP